VSGSRKIALGSAAGLVVVTCVFLIVVLVGQGLGQASLWATVLGLPVGIVAAGAGVLALVVKPSADLADGDSVPGELAVRQRDRSGQPASGSDSSALIRLAAVGVRGHHLEVWALRADGKISHSWWPRDDGEHFWNEPYDFGAPSGTVDIAVSSRGPGHAEVFAVDHHSNLWHKWWLHDEGWSKWQKFTDNVAGPLGACSFTDGHIQIFAMDAAGKSVRYSSSSVPAVWDPWATLDEGLDLK
jgi:hypothetical protein